MEKKIIDVMDLTRFSRVLLKREMKIRNKHGDVTTIFTIIEDDDLQETEMFAILKKSRLPRSYIDFHLFCEQLHARCHGKSFAVQISESFSHGYRRIQSTLMYCEKEDCSNFAEFGKLTCHDCELSW